MASKASSIQPRAAASKVRRCAGLACFRSWIGPIAMRGAIVSAGGGGVRKPPQILLRLPHIPPDLFFQGLDRRKLDLISQPIQEMEFNFGLCRKFKWMEVQQMRFDGERIAAECWTVSDIGYRVEA